MKKTMVLVAAATLALVSCAKVETGTATPGVVANDKVALDFGVYVPKVTKAGEAGEMNNAKLQSTGFGVIAYEKEGAYDGSTKPTFMYNQLVDHRRSGCLVPESPHREFLRLCAVCGRCLRY